jgi:hypothetical protein
MRVYTQIKIPEELWRGLVNKNFECEYYTFIGPSPRSSSEK